MINKVFLIGHAGKNAEVKTFSNGNSIVELPLATTENWKDKAGEWKDKTTWHNLVFNQEWASKIKKGELLHIEGKINNRSYEKDGIPKYRSEIRVSSFKRLTKQNQQEQNNQPEAEENAEDNNDLPF